MASFELSFRARTAASLVALTSLMLVGASSMVAGCSSSSDSSTPDAASQNCPVTIADAINTPKCTSNPNVAPCTVGFVCPQELNEIATCTCTSSAWACVDHTGAPITDPTAGTTCTNLGGGNDKECPADEATASFAGCKTSGLICSYAGQTCAGASAPNTDTCQCNGAGDGGLEFVCEQQTCIAPPTDSGITDTDSGDH
jgi:hypothetical protein